MNIPAELVDIANTCDMHGLRGEADLLTEIARTLMTSGRDSAAPRRQLVMEGVVSPAPEDNTYVS